MCEKCVDVASHKLMRLFMQKKGGCDHASGASENCLEFMPYIMSEDALLAREPLNSSLIW